MSGLESWLAVGDLDELVREVDRRCDRADWDGVDDVRHRCRSAMERGHQLWPAASYAEYRLALHAPAELAASVVVEGAGWMAPGPLAEVVAQDHSFAELAGHLDDGAPRRVVAAERVLRGEHVPEGEMGSGLPGALAPWEPDYLLATYRAEGIEAPFPRLDEPRELRTLPTTDPAAARGPGTPADPDLAAALEEGTRCLGDAVRHWASASEGRVQAAGAGGSADYALAALGHTAVRWRSATLREVGQLLAWAASDGGAHGRRRGAAAGRFELWWTLACLAGVEDDWPTDPSPEAEGLAFGMWLPEGPHTGWSCRVTVADPHDGLAWALDASDVAVEP